MTSETTTELMTGPAATGLAAALTTELTTGLTTDIPEAVRVLRARLAEIQRDAVTASPAGAGGADEIGVSAAGPVSDPAGRSSGGAAGDSAGDTPTDATLTEEERAEEQQARAICLRLLADSARPRAGLEQKLRQRDIRPAVITRVLDRFTEVGLIDDQAYADAYVRTKHQERALSRRALTAELRRKGLDAAVTEVAVEAIDSSDEESRATALVAKRVATALTAGPEAARRRLLALLDRRGYPADMSIRVVESVLGSHPEPQGS